MTPAVADRRGYTMVLPGGWVMIPLHARTTEVIDATVDALLDGMPQDSRAGRAHVLRTWLADIADDARRTGGLDLVLPVVPSWVQPASASIIIGRATAGTDVVEATQLRPTAQNGATVTTIDTLGGVAMREVLARPDPGETDKPEPAISVTYSWVPRRATVIMGTLVVTAAGFEGRQVVVDALTELGESMLSTIRFDQESI